MFKDIGALMGLMKNLPKIQEELARQQQTMSQLVADGEAGAGLVRVKINGNLQLTAVQISPEAMKDGDHELLAEMVKSATNVALAKIRQLMAEETQKTMGSLGLPAGMPLPGTS